MAVGDSPQLCPQSVITRHTFTPPQTPVCSLIKWAAALTWEDRREVRAQVAKVECVERGDGGARVLAQVFGLLLLSPHFTDTSHR